jgi:hypothetical protein
MRKIKQKRFVHTAQKATAKPVDDEIRAGETGILQLIFIAKKAAFKRVNIGQSPNPSRGVPCMKMIHWTY